AVPEVTIIEDRIDHGRHITRLYPTRANTVDMKYRIDASAAFVTGTDKLGCTDEVTAKGAGRGNDVIGRKGFAAASVKRIGKLIQGEIILGQGIVGAARRARWQRLKGIPLAGGTFCARIQLVFDPDVGTGMDMARTASHAIATDIHVPKQ